MVKEPQRKKFNWYYIALTMTLLNALFLILVFFILRSADSYRDVNWSFIDQLIFIPFISFIPHPIWHIVLVFSKKLT